MNNNTKGPFGEEIVFTSKFPKKLLKTKNSFWFVDSFFKNHDIFKDLKNISFVKAGEEAKSLKSFESNFKKLLDENANRQTTVFCVGGGSLGDSIGFLCSVYMRGMALVMLPTTWLACVDSSVGGKTALNGFGYKNIMGSFYPPLKIFYVKNLIKTSPVADAEGEILKTLFLNGDKKWARDLIVCWSQKGLDFSDLHRFVSYKAKIVKKDPDDSKGFRAVLNLGHTLGHALELEKKISHSEAVKQGLLFSLEWSYQKKILSLKQKEIFESTLNVKRLKMSESKLLKALRKDKKCVSSDKLNFIFVKDRGSEVQEVYIKDVIKEYKRQLKNG